MVARSRSRNRRYRGADDLLSERKYEEIAGSGKLRVTTRSDVAEIVVERTSDAEIAGLLPLSSGSSFFESLGLTGISPQLSQRVWTANRCLQLNSQQIASMPLRFFGSYEPAWVANPDPVWYPNGIGDAVFAAVWSMYAWGDAFIYITSRYASGFPSAWTVLDPAPVDVTVVNGTRRYRSGNLMLNPSDVVQISRNPGGVRGTSALQAYGSYLYGLLASSELARVLTGEGGVPNAVLKSQRKIDATQAAALQTMWSERTSVRRGAPAVLPPDIDFQQLSFSPQDLMLLDVQQFDAQVIASAFGVPPYMVNLPIEHGLTYQSPGMLGEHWWRFELLPCADRLQRAFNAAMLPRGSWVEFDAYATLAPPFKESVDAWTLLVEKGIVTVNEARAAVVNLPPMEQGEALAELIEPPTASASPAQAQSASVVSLRPTGVTA